MAHLIDKDTLVAEIERRRDLHYKYYMKNGAGSIAECKYDEDREILSFIDTLEVKEVGISILNIDDTLKEEGFDPDSKEAKVFKESYYTALEKLKAQKGE